MDFFLSIFSFLFLLCAFLFFSFFLSFFLCLFLFPSFDVALDAHLIATLNQQCRCVKGTSSFDTTVTFGLSPAALEQRDSRACTCARARAHTHTHLVTGFAVSIIHSEMNAGNAR